MLAHLRIKQIYSKAGRLHSSKNKVYPHWVVASRASISNIQNRNSWCAAIPEHIEYAKLGNGQQWEFQAGAMARLASGSIVLNTNVDNAILGTVVCKYSEKLFDEAEEEKMLDEAEDAVAIEQFEEEGRERREREVRHENEEKNIEEDEEAIDEVGGRRVAEKTTRKERKQEMGEGKQSSSTQSLPQMQGLTVDFRQSAAALGRIPMNYFRRELQHSDQDVAISRVIDRSIRPIVHPNFTGRTHISCKPLAMDDAGDAVVMGINVASAALAVSPVPQRCLMSACRVAIVDGMIQVNPPREDLKRSSLDLVLTGTVNNTKNEDGEEIDDDRLIMIEMEGKEVELDKFVESVNRGFDEIRTIQSAIQRLVQRVGSQKYKITSEGSEYRDELSKHVSACEEGIEEILKEHGHTKHSRGQAIETLFQTWCMLMKRYYKQYNESTLRAAYSELVKKVHRRVVLETGLRVDGRRPEQFRPIQCRVDLYRKLHGSAIFQRGQSQVLSTVTFDSPQAAFHPDAIAQLLGDQRKKSFMLHYEFPQFATNEIDTVGASKNRREIGHGLLAEKALKQMVPDDFPYTIRLACQVLESNGSTSMASVCAGSMALYDAGVHLMANHVAGLAMGLITEKEEESCEKEEGIEENPVESKSIPDLPKFPEKYTLLTDLAGFEDYSGDMDFKIAGTSKGFTAMQMDIKICGLPIKVFKEALERSRIGLEHVLVQLRDAIPEPRSDYKPTVPIIELMQLAPYKRPILFRSGAYNAKFIEAETGVKNKHRRVVLETGLRVDGRRPEQFRPIQCRVDLYRKLHGSAIFQRGQSQVLSTVTFDSPQAAFHPDAIAQLLGDQRKKSFMLHYEFPQFATNEIDTVGASKNRREIGHGLLAEKALKQMVPDDFPYTIRLACQVLESNGSTSMASVCAGSMALYDAGVHLMANHVAGLAMGLITEKEEESCEKEEGIEENPVESKSIPDLPKFPEKYTLLTDLAGFEDYSGDMDFKIAGTSKGFTAMQMDIKICGLPIKVFKEALERSRIGLEHVLVQLRDAIPEPRSDYKPTVPIIELMQLAPYKRPILFRSGAYNAKFIEAETGVKISIEDDSNISLFAPNRDRLERAQQMINRMMEQQQDEHYQFGAVYKAKILQIMEGGVRVTLKDGGSPIWIRNVDLSAVPGRKNAFSLGLEVGQDLKVQYFGRDQHTGQHRLTRKTLQVLDPPVQNLFKSKELQQKQEKLEKKKSDLASKSQSNGSTKNEK